MDEAINDKFDQILKFNLDDEKFEDENQTVPYLRMITDYRYGVEVSNHRKWGNKDSPVEHGRFYQIIPDRVDDGFFDWYCNICPYHQLFKTVEMALLRFVFYWNVWRKDHTAPI